MTLGLKHRLLKQEEETLSAIEQNREALLTAWVAATGHHPTDCVMVQQTLPDGRVAMWIQPKSVIPLAAANQALDRIWALLTTGPGNDSWRNAIIKAVGYATAQDQATKDERETAPGAALEPGQEPDGNGVASEPPRPSGDPEA